MNRKYGQRGMVLARWLILLLVFTSVACAGPLQMGRYFGNSCAEIKEGYHTSGDVIRIMGSDPYSRETDPKGRRIFVYFWADGRGDGKKCVILFNRKDRVMLKTVAP